jgi:hypothetical protein
VVRLLGERAFQVFQGRAVLRLPQVQIAQAQMDLCAGGAALQGFGIGERGGGPLLGPLQGARQRESRDR